MKHFAAVIAGSLLLAAAFWDPLLRGGGFVGGDVYSYYFPQKTFYAECLRLGEWPFWNPLVGHGYPVLGESQTGVFYPPNLALYRLLDVHTAYHVNHLVHYALAFSSTVLLGRSLGLGWLGSLFSGMVYAYGWFPVRSCWEWAIIGGAWLPLALWCADRMMRAGRVRDAVGLSLALGVPMLAGHDHISFLSLLTVGGWILFRAVWRPAAALPSVKDGSSRTELASTGTGGGDTPTAAVSRPWSTIALACVAIVGALGLAAVQWGPTAELLRNSQRQELGELHNPSRGRIPWQSAPQLLGWTRHEVPTGVVDRPDTAWAPWCSPLVNRDAMLAKWSNPVPTNQVEATLFFGTMPLALALFGAARALRGSQPIGWFWIALGVASLIYATGRLVPWVQWLPGFGWFHGPGRWGLLATLAVSQLAGSGLDALSRGGRPSVRGALGCSLALGVWTMSCVASDVAYVAEATGAPSSLQWFGVPLSEGFLLVVLGGILTAGLCGLWWIGRGDDLPDSRHIVGRRLLVAAIVSLTALEFWVTSRLVTYSPMVLDPPLAHLAESPVRKALFEESGGRLETIRLQAPGGNLATVLGVASTPPYFTFGPKEYASPLPLPEWPRGMPKRDAITAARLRQQLLGVTHLLTFERLDDRYPADVTLLWQGIDPFLNRAWARFGEPIFLYRRNDALGRVWFARDGKQMGRASVVEFSPNRVTIDAESAEGGRVVLTDLLFPGWNVTVDDTPADAAREYGWFRAVDVPAGRHRITWTYRPSSVYWGALASGMAVAMLFGMAFVRPKRNANPPPVGG